jgi:hypothetical protein
MVPQNTIAEFAEPGGRPIPTDPDAALYPAEAAFIIGLTVRALEAWRAQDRGPPYFKIGQRTIRYQRCALLAWIERRSVRPEAA